MDNLYKKYIQINKPLSLNNLPNHLNMLDNFGFIVYNKIILFRIPINPNNSRNIENFLYSPTEDENLISIESEKSKKKDKFIDIDAKKIFQIKKKEKKFCQFFSSDPNESKGNIEQIFSQLKEKDHLEPQPPQRFISIINERV